MLLKDLSKNQLVKIKGQVLSGNKMFARVIMKYLDLEPGSIVELCDVRCYEFAGRQSSTIYGRPYRARESIILGQECFELAPDATKTWSPEKPKVDKPVLADPEIFDGLGQPVLIGDVLALVDNGKMCFAIYKGFKGINTLWFRDTQRGEDFRRMPSGLCERRRQYTFDHSVKITDKATLDLMTLRKLAA